MAISVVLRSLVAMICPEASSAVALRTSCRDLRYALPEGAICILKLAGLRPLNALALAHCALVLQSRTTLLEGRCWCRLVMPSLISTLESFGSLLCPHVRYFCNEADILAQMRLTIAVLSRWCCCAQLVRDRCVLMRMARCSDQVRAMMGCLTDA